MRMSLTHVDGGSLQNSLLKCSLKESFGKCFFVETKRFNKELCLVPVSTFIFVGVH